jgi:hypothetical protein
VKKKSMSYLIQVKVMTSQERLKKPMAYPNSYTPLREWRIPARNLIPSQVIASPDACEAFASTPFIREDNRRLVPAAVSVDIVLLPAVLGVPGHWVQHAVSAGTQRLPRHYAQILVLRI